MINNRDWSIKYSDAKQQPDGSWSMSDGTTRWYNDMGALHRDNGPAIIDRNTARIYWWHNGSTYSFNHWCTKVNISDEQKLLLRLQYE
jgi:hypothetical protein